MTAEITRREPPAEEPRRYNGHAAARELMAFCDYLAHRYPGIVLCLISSVHETDEIATTGFNIATNIHGKAEVRRVLEELIKADENLTTRIDALTADKPWDGKL